MSTNPDANTTEKPNVSANQSVAAAEDTRIIEVEKEVKKLKSDVESFMELKNTVDDLKNTIVDIRALINEAQSPFNLLQFITNEDDLNKVIQAKPLIEKKLLVKAGEKRDEAKGAIQVETPIVTEAAKVNAPTGFSVETVAESKGPAQMGPSLTDETEKAEKEIKISPASTLEEQNNDRSRAYVSLEEVSPSDVNKDTSIVHWIYMMLDLGFDEKSIRKICDYCEFSGFMPKGYGAQIVNLVGAIVRARSQNLSAEEVILSLYGAANASGVKTDAEDLKRLITSVLRKGKTGGA